MRKAAFVILLLVAAATGAFFYFRGRSNGPPGTIRVYGNIEVTEAELAFKVPGRLAHRFVDEGAVVKTGQLVAQLDVGDLAAQAAARRAEVGLAEAALSELLAGSRPEEIAQAEASVQRFQAALDALVAGSRPQEIASAAAAVDLQKAEVQRLRIEADRQRQLLGVGLATLRDEEVARTAYEVAKNRMREAQEREKLVVEGPRTEEIRQARASLSEARERLALVRKGPRPEVVDQARARLQQARANLVLAETYVGYGALLSPLSGIVLSKSAEPGEFLSPGSPVLTVGELSRVWLRAYVSETDLGRVKLGQRARVISDTYPGREYEGRVAFLASEAEFTPKAVQTPKERVKLVYRVKVELPNPHQELKPGMPAEGLIEVGR